MYKFAIGVNFEDEIDIKEGFSIKDSVITVNLSIDKFPEFFENILEHMTYPAFFALHCPEDKQRETEDGQLYEDVYYMDDCDIGCIKRILRVYSKILFNDGLIKFGIASHIRNEEVFVDEYKTIYIFTKEMNKYEQSLLNIGLLKYADMKTAKEFISHEHVCVRKAVRLDRTDIHDVIKDLKQDGMYYEKTILI